MAEPSRHLDLPRGFHDSHPERAATYEQLRHDWFAVCALAGYQPVEVPPVGFQDTFTHGHHAAGSRLYPLVDRSGRDLALVSDSLRAVLRLAHARGLLVQRLSYCCPVFRYVRRPRRYFHHLGLMEVTAGPTDLPAQHRSARRLAHLVATFLVPRLKAHFTVADPGLWRDLIADTTTGACELLNELRRRSSHERAEVLKAAGCSSRTVRVAGSLADDPGLRSDDSVRALEHCSPVVHQRVAQAHSLAEAIRRAGASCEVDLGCLHANEFHDGPSFQVRPQQGRLLGDGGTYDVFASTFIGTPTSANSAHSTPGRPEGRGKIERLFRTVRDQFLVEITGEEPVEGRHHVADLLELNRLFTAWVETTYHRTVHSETGREPLTRWMAGGPFPLPSTGTLAEAFRWSEHRTVRKTRVVSLHDNLYEVDPVLIGCKVELVFDPFDLTRLEVRYRDTSYGWAVPFRIGRHAHPKARPETPPEPPVTPTGIDYARLLDAAHQAELAQGINYAALANPGDDVLPGQLDLLTGDEARPLHDDEPDEGVA